MAEGLSSISSSPVVACLTDELLLTRFLFFFSFTLFLSYVNLKA